MKIGVPIALIALMLSGLTLVGPATAATDVAHSSSPALGRAADVAARSGVPVATVRRADARRLNWTPAMGPVFNNPYSSKASVRRRIERRIINQINHTPSWGKIRMAMYSFDRHPVADALIRAKRRGVSVQLILNNHEVTRAQRKLRRALGTNRWGKKNFIIQCRNSCRDVKNNLHSKFFLFSRTGRGQQVMNIGSANMKLNGIKWQWNDMLTIQKRKYLWQRYMNLFNDMKKDYSSRRKYSVDCNKPRTKKCFPFADRIYNRVFPRLVSASNDPVLQMLGPVKCVYQANGKTHRTKLRVSMHTMRGNRGDYIARRLRTLWANGCDIKVLYGLMGWFTKKELGAKTKRGRIPLRSTGFDTNGDGEVNRYTHEKYLVVRGHYGGKVRAVVYTGSSNWSMRGNRGDEIIFKINNARYFRAYNRSWQTKWSSNRYSRNAYTTTAQRYQTRVMTRNSHGELVPRMVTRTRTVVVNRPDNLRPGDTWEHD